MATGTTNKPASEHIMPHTQVTIYSDASLAHQQSTIAGSGYVILATTHKKIEGSNVFHASSSFYAELTGCLNALAVMVDNNLVGEDTTVLLCCDSMPVLYALMARYGMRAHKEWTADKPYTPKPENATKINAVFESFDLTHKLPPATYMVKHVKGHQGSIASNDVVHQRQCDRLAKAARLSGIGIKKGIESK